MRKKTSSVPDSISLRLDVLTKELREIGVSYVGHGVVSLQGDHTGYFSNQEWQNIYLSGRFFHNEPILDAFIKNPLGAVHWQCVEKNEVASMRREVVDILGGVTLCNFYHSFFGFLNIGFSDERNTYDFLKKNKPLIGAYHQSYDQIHLFWRAVSRNEEPSSRQVCQVTTY